MTPVARLCYDSVTGKCFYATTEELEKVVNKANERLNKEGQISAEVLLEMLDEAFGVYSDGLPIWSHTMSFSKDKGQFEVRLPEVRYNDNGEPYYSVGGIKYFHLLEQNKRID